MDSKPSNSIVLMAPPHGGFGGTLRLPGVGDPPPIDARLVKPETREQFVRGRSVIALPSNPEHGDRHFELDYVIRAHVKEDYVGSTDLLTRCSVGSDFASDTCVRRKGEDPGTKTRYLEELVFEVVNEQSLRDITEQAEDLTARGVRRVLAIFVKTGDVREWSPKDGDWNTLDFEGTISDVTLARPLRVRELLSAAEADNAVAQALLVKENPVLVAAMAESLKKGLRQGIEAACELSGIELEEDRRAQLRSLDVTGLEDLLTRIRSSRRWP